MGVHYKIYDRVGNFDRRIPAEEAKTLTSPEDYLDGISCFIIQNGNFIFEKRSSTQIDGGFYDSCSGHVDDDESYEDAMIRELGEELGIPEKIAKNIEEICRCPLTIERRPSQKNWHMVFYCLVIPSDLELKGQISEVSQIVKVPFDKAKAIIESGSSYMFPYGEYMAEMLQKLKEKAS